MHYYLLSSVFFHHSIRVRFGMRSIAFSAHTWNSAWRWKLNWKLNRNSKEIHLKSHLRLTKRNCASFHMNYYYYTQPFMHIEHRQPTTVSEVNMMDFGFWNVSMMKWGAENRNLFSCSGLINFSPRSFSICEIGYGIRKKRQMMIGSTKTGLRICIIVIKLHDADVHGCALMKRYSFGKKKFSEKFIKLSREFGIWKKIKFIFDIKFLFADFSHFLLLLFSLGPYIWLDELMLMHKLCLKEIWTFFRCHVQCAGPKVK